MNRERSFLLLVFLVAATFIFAGLGKLPLLDPDEGRNSEVAKEMQVSGAWLVPSYDGLVYLDKPALYFRAVATSFALFGTSEAAARLPSALSGMALLLVVYAFCKRVYNARTAALAVLVVGTTPLFFAFARLVIFDMMLTLFVCAAIFAGYIAEEEEGSARGRWYLAGAAAAAIATLVKGPVGFILPGLVLFVFNWHDGRRGAWRRFFAPQNLAVFLAIVLGWFFAVSWRQPDFPYYGLVEETFHRFTTSGFHRTAPVYYFFIVIAGLFFPWSALLPEPAVTTWRTRQAWHRADRLFVVFAVVVVGFFSLSQSKLPGYVLPAVVALGVLVARVFELALENRDGGAERIVVRGAAVLGIASAVMAVLVAVHVFHLANLQELLHIRSRQFERLELVFPAVMWSLAAGAVASVAAYFTRNVRAVLAAFVLFPIVLFIGGFRGMVEYAQADSSQALAQGIPALAPDADVACLECFPTGLPFYLHRRVILFTMDGHETTSNYVIFSLQRHQPWPEEAVPWEMREDWLASRNHPVYLLARQREKAELESLASRRGGTVTELQPGWWGALLAAPGGR
jgi:4-amino-4-deoxy-L-arabinose transferase-like glycosyltransferase